MGSRMPSRQSSAAGPIGGTKLRKSIDQEGKASRPASNSFYSGSTGFDGPPATELTPIESIPTTRMEPANPAHGSVPAFTQKELDTALKKARNVGIKV
jgi:hypothetical protein